MDGNSFHANESLNCRSSQATQSKHLRRTLAGLIILIAILLSVFSAIPVYALTTTSVTVIATKVVGTNNTGIAMKLDYEWREWRDSATLKQVAKAAGVKFIVFYTWKSSSPKACISWNEATKTGTFDWTNVDSLISSIRGISAEPILSLGGYDMSSKWIPKGMATNPATGLPYPASWAAYCAQWVKHFKAIGVPFKYYEITTEPFKYFGWTADLTKLGYYVQLWNAAARAMRAVNPNVLLSQDFITAQRVLNYWIKYGDNVDFLDFHKYDSYALSGTGYCTDSQLLYRAETSRFTTTVGGTYGVADARQIWFNARGKWLPVIDSECNLNSYWTGGTDPRIQKMVGAVWTALVLRTSILDGVTCNAYFSFGSHPAYTQIGKGFGLVNLDNGKPWYPYYVNKWIGSNLKIGDPLVNSTSSSSNVRSLAWIDNSKLNILVINIANTATALSIKNIPGPLNYYKIDNTYSYLTPQVQTGTLNPATILTMNGYAVVLLQTTA